MPDLLCELEVVRFALPAAREDKAVLARSFCTRAELIDRFTSEFDHAKYKDEYRRRLLAVVQRKRRGEEVHATPREKEERPSDLLEALRASVDAGKARKNAGSAARRKSRRASRARK